MVSYLKEDCKLKMFQHQVLSIILGPDGVKEMQSLECCITMNFVIYRSHSAVVMGWACNPNGEDRNFIRNFSEETSWKGAAWVSQDNI
jgi:hypothetical protein